MAQKQGTARLDLDQHDSVTLWGTGSGIVPADLDTKADSILAADRSLDGQTVGSSEMSLIGIGDNKSRDEHELHTESIHSTLKSTQQNSASYSRLAPNPGQPKRVQFKSLLASIDPHPRSEDEVITDVADSELASVSSGQRLTSFTSLSRDYNYCDNDIGHQLVPDCDSDEELVLERCQAKDLGGISDSDIEGETKIRSGLDTFRLESPSKRKQPVFNYLRTSKLSFISRLFDRRPAYNILSNEDTNEEVEASHQSQVGFQDTDLSSGTGNYNYKNLIKRKTRANTLRGRTFRGSYRYSRSDLSMTILKKVLYFIFQRSTLALFGAFLIHITLGTVYTLSNVNSYLTSYMRVHGYPKTTYAWSVWISSTYAVGQGFSMVLGGYLEKRFSAKLACTLGCAIHSISTMSTSKSIDYGPLAVLLTYGFMPGFGCGLAYMTPMSNGFGWFPDRKGLVAGVILAGFGIGTFVFNMAQTAFVNPDNLSPLDNADGYFTQEAVLKKVPDLFIFMGSIYAAMQLVGCCLLFKPPSTNTMTKPIIDRMGLIEPDVSLSQAVRKREFIVLFMVYGVTTQGVLFVNSMLKEYGQTFIGSDMYLAWVGSMASIANSAGRLVWGLAIDRYSFTICFSAITTIFGSILFIMPFEFILSSRLFYLLGTLGLFGSFSGWMSTYPVHLSRVFGRTNSGMIYGVIYTSQSVCGIFSAMATHYLIDHFSRFIPFFCMAFLQAVGLILYHVFYPK